MTTPKKFSFESTTLAKGLAFYRKASWTKNNSRSSITGSNNENIDIMSETFQIQDDSNDCNDALKKRLCHALAETNARKTELIIAAELGSALVNENKTLRETVHQLNNKVQNTEVQVSELTQVNRSLSRKLELTVKHLEQLEEESQSSTLCDDCNDNNNNNNNGNNINSNNNHRTQVNKDRFYNNNNNSKNDDNNNNRRQDSKDATELCTNNTFSIHNRHTMKHANSFKHNHARHMPARAVSSHTRMVRRLRQLEDLVSELKDRASDGQCKRETLTSELEIFRSNRTRTEELSRSCDKLIEKNRFLNQSLKEKGRVEDLVAQLSTANYRLQRERDEMRMLYEESNVSTINTHSDIDVHDDGAWDAPVPSIAQELCEHAVMMSGSRELWSGRVDDFGEKHEEEEEEEEEGKESDGDDQSEYSVVRGVSGRNVILSPKHKRAHSLGRVESNFGPMTGNENNPVLSSQDAGSEIDPMYFHFHMLLQSAKVEMQEVSTNYDLDFALFSSSTPTTCSSEHNNNNNNTFGSSCDQQAQHFSNLRTGARSSFVVSLEFLNTINTQELYDTVVASREPFHLWSSWIRQQLTTRYCERVLCEGNEDIFGCEKKSKNSNNKNNNNNNNNIDSNVVSCVVEQAKQLMHDGCITKDEFDHIVQADKAICEDDCMAERELI